MRWICLPLLAVLMSACSTPSKTTVAAAVPPPPVIAKPAPAAVPAATVAAVSRPDDTLQQFERRRAAVDAKSVFFDYDRYEFKPDEEALIVDHANLAIAYPKDRITLIGNCDERGSSEYNLALGQRRAQDVKERLMMLGVPQGRIETVSYGKEKPRDSCHAERCWAENRRADFVDTWK